MDSVASNETKTSYEAVIRDVLYSLSGNKQFLTIKPGINLAKYGFDSILFVSVIVKLEEILGIEVPNEYMRLNKGDSIKKLCVMLEIINK